MNALLNAAWKVRGLTGTEKLVLIRLADRADRDGKCYPGQKSIADDCCISVRTVRKAIKSLTAKGHLVILQFAGYSSATTYRVTPSPPESASAPPGSSRRSPPEAASASLYRTPIQPPITNTGASLKEVFKSNMRAALSQEVSQ